MGEDMSNEVIITIIGFASTLAGTFLGWFLNQLSQRGKLCFYTYSWTNDFFRINEELGGEVESGDYNESKRYSFELDIDVYNSSNTTKIMRMISITFFAGKVNLLSCIPNDTTSRKTIACAIRYDEVTHINVPAKQSLRLRFQKSIDLNNHRNLESANSVILNYRDEKNRIKRISIPFIDFATHFAKKKEATPNV